MTIQKKTEGNKLTAVLSGRLDTVTAPAAETELTSALDGVTEFVLDFSALDYISSAGLRVLLSLQKRMNKQGSMVIRNANETVREIFEVTGFSDILTVE